MSSVARQADQPAVRARENLTDISPQSAIHSGKAGSIGGQATRSREFTPLIHRWNELIAPVEEKWVVADQKRIGVQLGEGSEGGLEFALGAGLHDTELHPSRPRSFSPDSDEEPDTVGDGSEDDRDCRGCVARRLCRGDAARSYDQVDLMGRRDRLPTQAVDRNGPRPSCIQPPRLVPRHNPLRGVPGEMRPHWLQTHQAITGIAFCCARDRGGTNMTLPKRSTNSRRFISR